MTPFEVAQDAIRAEPRRWLVTGAAGFIGSNLAEFLVALGQQVTGLDNLSTGHRRNIDELDAHAGASSGSFRFIEGDIRDPGTCAAACEDVDYVLHQAALGSVPRSVADPLTTNEANITGFLNMLVAARDARVRRFVYAASSSTYGDHPGLPKVEDRIGRPLSPYAVTKYVNELYADVFQRTYGLESIGLRYFNVFGRRQDPEGAYAAVIPRWIGRMISGEPCVINGDGESSRDFCYVDNVIQANLLAAVAPAEASGQVYNIAVGDRTTLNELFAQIQQGLQQLIPGFTPSSPEYREFRPGDVRHSQADIGKARHRLGYEPACDVRAGLAAALKWYVQDHLRRTAPAPGA